MLQNQFVSLLEDHNLPASLIYLAPVIPVVQTMWADGKNQVEEREKLKDIIGRHCRALSELAAGAQVVTFDDAERFNQTFIDNEPDKHLLEAFAELASERIKNQIDSGTEQNSTLYNRDHLFQACLEIAAACAVPVQSPQTSEYGDRIATAEREFIDQVFSLLQLRT
jgi:hypothetical protein